MQLKLFALGRTGQVALAAGAGENAPLLQMGADHRTHVTIMSRTAFGAGQKWQVTS